MCELIAAIRDTLSQGEVSEMAVHKLQDVAQRFIPKLQAAIVSKDLEKGRYLLYKDPDYGFVIMMLVWGVGDATPIHAHGTWGIEAVVKNHVRVTSYTYCHKSPKEIGSVVLPAGSVAYVLPPDADVHCVAQWGLLPAVTVHIYGKELTENIVFMPGKGFQPCAVTCRPMDLDIFNLVNLKIAGVFSNPCAVMS